MTVERAAGWRPLLDDAPAAEALLIVDEIASTVAPLMQADEGGADLADGASGGALLYAALERAGRRGPDLPTTRELLRQAVERLRREPLPPSLWAGTGGVAYALAQLEGRLPSATLTHRLSQWVRGGAGGEYDLMAGAIGIGVVALELGPDQRGAELLEAVVGHLAERAEQRDDGLTWASARPAGSGLGLYNLGVAHGVPGVVGLLAGAMASERAPRETRELLAGAVRWVLAQRLAGNGGCLPYAVGGWRDSEPARLAWCYGDAGAAVTLLLAARALDDREVEAAAREVAARAAARRPETAGVVDSGVCHGSSGLAHVFGRLWQLTGDERHAAAGRYWLRRTLELPRPTGAGWLTGAAGVALVLLAACTSDDPSWDRALLASHRFVEQGLGVGS